MTAIVSLKNIAVQIDEKAILSDIAFDLMPGEILGLVGPSGCGKTTLLNTVAGFISPCFGEIDFNQTKLVADNVFVAPEKRNIGVIFQDYALFPHLTVKENIGFGIQQLAKPEYEQRIEQLLSLLKINLLADRFPHQLSGGQKQRVAIARALAPQTKLLLLDEPFSNIDARLRNELMFEMRTLLKQLNISAIFVTHNKDEVFTFADKVAVMHQGQILQLGAPIEVCQKPNSWQVADFLQLGSWLPVNCEAGRLHSIIGNFDYPCTENQQLQLLLKPIDIEVSEGEANSVINHINITEQGFHYILDSIEKNSSLSFQQLSFYSQQVFALGEQINITIKPHEYILFPN